MIIYNVDPILEKACRNYQICTSAKNR